MTKLVYHKQEASTTGTQVQRHDYTLNDSELVSEDIWHTIGMSD